MAGVIFLALGISSRLTGAFQATKKQTQYTVTRVNLQQTLTLSGKIEAEEKALLHFQTSGRLAWVGVKVGDKVSAYQTIASLDQRDVQKNLEKKLNSYLKTRWDFEQTQDDYEGKILTDAIKRILEKSQFDLNNAVLDVEIQHLAVEFAHLITPIGGFVTKVNPQVAGVNVTPTSSEFEVINPTSIYLSVLADQTEVTKLKEGMKTDIVFDAYPSEHIEGTIKSIGFAPKPDETSTAYEVKVLLATGNEAYRYRLGMTADSTFTIREKPDVLAIPTHFLKRDNGKTYVVTHMRGKLQNTPVTIGEETETLVEITSGLSEGDTIYD